MKPAALLATLCALSGLGSCATYYGSAPVSLATEPPGARVIINGEESGFATPCQLALARGDRHRVELNLDGYRPEVRILDPGVAVWSVKWAEMLNHWNNWRFPLWLNLHDLTHPVRIERHPYSPRIFVDLERSADR